MFNGFPSTNTPAIQVWEMSVVPTSGGQRSLTLTDDCAPIQYFRTGGSTNVINVYLPITPPEGKIIKVVNHRYGANNQHVAVYYPDTGTSGAVQYFALGVGQVIDFCFSRTAYGYGPSAGYQRTGWIMLQQAGSSSAGYYGVSLSDGSHASAAQSMVMGGTGNTATSAATASFIAGGSGHSVSNANSAIIGGSSSTCTGNGSVVLGGTFNGCGGGASVTLGGALCNASGGNSATIGGNTLTATASWCVSMGGTNNAANANTAIVFGGSYGTTRSVQGMVTNSAFQPIATGSGISQASRLVLGTQTTDATVTTITSNGSAAATTNQLVLPNNSAYYFRGSVISNVTGGGNTKAWTFEGAIKRGANAASTAIVGAITENIVAADAGAAAWDVTVDADTTNGCLRIRVTGAAATTIRWVCRLDSTEVAF
jgi:hypothetical protein